MILEVSRDPMNVMDDFMVQTESASDEEGAIPNEMKNSL